MKKSTYFIMTLAAGIGFIASFNINTAEIDITLDEALKKGLIQCKSNGIGGHSGKCVSLSIHNNTSSTYKIAIPRGTLFYPSDPGEQTLITVNQQSISVGPSASLSESINAYCSEHTDRSPSNNTNFVLGKNKNPKFDSLFVFMKNREINASQQDIVWAISDNSPVSNVGMDTKNMRDIRSFLSKITGQEEVSYSIVMISGINALGYITQAAIQLKGFLKFNVDKRKWIHQEVYDESGRLKFKSDQAFEIPKGESDYTFNIGVRNWASGNYTLKLKAGSEVVELYKFKV